MHVIRKAVRILTCLSGAIFCLCAGYTLLTFAFPLLVVYSMFVHPFLNILTAFAGYSGLAFLTILSLDITISKKSRPIYAILGLVVGVTGFVVVFGYVSNRTVEQSAQLEAIKTRERYVSELPAVRSELRTGENLIVQGYGNGACNHECVRWLYSGAVPNFTVAYRRKDTMKFREYRLSTENGCASVPEENWDRSGYWATALYRLANVCLVARDYSAAPDGVWIQRKEQVDDRPDFKFKGDIVEITRKAGANTELLVHYEQGQGFYDRKIPVFVRWLNSGRARIETASPQLSYSYGKRRNLNELIEDTLGLPVGDALYSDRMIDHIRVGIDLFESRYRGLSTTDKKLLYGSLVQAVHNQPQLSPDVRALVELGMEDIAEVRKRALSVVTVSLRHDDLLLPILIRTSEDPDLLLDTLYGLRDAAKPIDPEQLRNLANRILELPTENSSEAVKAFTRLANRQGENLVPALRQMFLSNNPYASKEAAHTLLNQYKDVDFLRQHEELQLDLYRLARPEQLRGNWYFIVRIGLAEEAIDILQQRIESETFTEKELDLLNNELQMLRKRRRASSRLKQT